MEFIILLIVAIIFLIPFWVLILDGEKYWTKKKTYIVIWRYDAMCPNTAVIVEAKSLAKAWEKVQKQHCLPIDLVSIKEI